MTAIAIVGMSCRFPDATNVDEFWNNLRAGRESISFLKDEELLAAGVSPVLLRDRRYVRAASALKDIDKFDASFFGFSPREAQLMDPQHRLFMECSWEALESAGCTPDAFDGQIGVYAGVSISNYLLHNLHHRLGAAGFVGDFQTVIGNDKDYLATHVSYKLNLKGPSVSVQTACSSSLVAVCMGCQSLLNYECDVVLAGGVTVRVPHRAGYLYEEGGIMSPDGRCRTFDHKSRGTIFGSGVGVVVLKRLDDALTAGDCVHAVIKGFGVNNDGSEKVGYTAPSVDGQSRVVAMAQALAGVEPETISYIEAHGTGTPIGDPIEVAALTQVFRASTQKKNFCALGSVKSNFGHLESAAGIAGLLKTVLALKHKMLPASLHCERPNPDLHLDSSPFYINTTLSEWKSPSGPRRAGVSSFGIGGTNAHVVLEEAPSLPSPGASGHPLPEGEGQTGRPMHVLTLTAKTSEALTQLAASYADHLESHSSESFADVCFSANTGRVRFNHRLAVVAENSRQAVQKLRADTDRLIGRLEDSDQPRLAFLFTGQGSQYTGMGRLLYETQPLFRETLNQCNEMLKDKLEQPLLSVLYSTDATESLHETAHTQPALFALEYALAQLWRTWGVNPHLVAGHSIGEYVAACVAGVFSLEEAICLIAERGRLMQQLEPRGTMVAVYASESEVRRRLQPLARHLAIAAVNGRENIVISGDQEQIDQVVAELRVANIRSQRLRVSHAFHSHVMDSILDAFRRAAEKVHYASPQIPLVSNLTGRIVSPDEITKAAYWVKQLRQTVQFAATMETLRDQGCRVFLEIGPKPTLTPLGQQIVGPDTIWINSLREGRNDWQQLLTSVGQLVVNGVEIDWNRFDRDYHRRRVPVPTYAFQRKSYWIDRPDTAQPIHEERASTSHPFLQRRLNSPLREIQFESHVSAASPMLRDHTINGVAVFPGAAYLEMACAGIRMTFGEGPYALEHVIIQEPLLLSGSETRVLQFVLTPAGDKEGSFQIVSSSPNADRPSWKLHTSGRFRSEPVRESVQSLEKINASCGDMLSDQSLYADFEKRGLTLGPACQWLQEIRRGNGEALGKMRSVRDEDGENAYHLHPGLIDSCFQLIAAASGTRPGIHVPAEFESVHFYAAPSGAVWGYAAVRDEGITADVSLMDAVGRTLFEVSGLRAKAVSPESFGARPSESWRDWLYEIRWEEKARTHHGPPDFIPSTTSIASLMERQRAALNADRHLELYEEIAPQLDRLTTLYIADALKQLGWRWEDRLSVKTPHRRLLIRLFGILTECANGEGDLHILQDLINRYPQLNAEFTLLERCGRNLAGVLKGTINPLEVLFPGGSLATLEKLYQDSPASRACNGLVQGAVSAVLEKLPKGRSVRILEIGAGTGGTTTYVLPVVSGIASEYVFTDVSPQFTSKAETKFRDYPFVRYQILDIERPPIEQGFRPHEFDIVLAANVLHATADLRQVLGHVKQLLTPEGLVVLLEGTGPQRWLDLIFGMTEGWWKFRDDDVRESHPLLRQDRWLALLEECGFVEPVAVPGVEESRTGVPEPALIMARAPVEMKKEDGRWLIFGDERGVGGSLAAALEKAGERTELVLASEGQGVRRVVEKEKWRGIVHLWSLDQTVEDLEKAQQQGCGSVLEVVQAVVGKSEARPPRLWLVTGGAQAAGENEGPLNVAQAPLWGFGRVIALEHPDLGCTCVDVEATITPDRIDALAGELLAADEEDQIALRADVRYVARLSKKSAPHDTHFRLDIPTRGVLNNLTFVPASPRKPASGEVQIQVAVSGLNFKDILNALGTYPGEAGRLGFECSGKVVEIGSEVQGIKIDDEVVALAPGTFADVVTTRADLTVLKPPQLTFEQAAAIPVAYLTAHYGLTHLARMKRGDAVLIHAAAGGVGMAAVRLAQRCGATIVATAGSPEKREYLQSLGISCVSSSRSAEFVDQVMEKTRGRGVDIVLNSLSGDFISKSFSVLAPGGRFVEIGKIGIWNEAQARKCRSDVEYFTIDFDSMLAKDPVFVGTMLRGLIAEFSTGALAPLPLNTFSIHDAANAFRFMAQSRHIGKIVLNHGPSVRADRTYLITGGHGGLGQKIAARLAERGARHLVLVGRSEPSRDAREGVERLRSAGVLVSVMQADVSRAEDVAKVFAEIRVSMPALGGLIHAAGVLDDGVVVHQNWQRFARVMAPKVSGAWNLHRATEGMPLDFFVLFSSVASLVGSPGQSNHAAANAFLDALAHYRRSKGLPGLSINWGAWSEIGAAAARMAEGTASNDGIQTITPEQGVQAFEAAMRWGTTQIGVFAVDWSKFLHKLAGSKTPALLSEFSGKQQHSPDTPITTERTDFLQRLRQTMAPERRNFVLEQIRIRAAKVLGLPAQTIELRQPLSDLGLDSLMAIELRNTLGVIAGRTLPATLLFDYPTIQALGDHLSPDLLKEAPVKQREIAKPAAGAGVEPIAIVGIGCRFPGGAVDPESFWQLLANGSDAITDIPANRWNVDAYYDPDPAVRGKMNTRWGGFLDRIDEFDAPFFGISPREAVSMDPQQRLALETAWAALEHAGQAPDQLAGTNGGVFLGISQNEYAQLIDAATEIDMYLSTGNALSVAAGRISYLLGLNGPSMAVDTACSSSLVAVHLAVQSLRAEECDMALAGGVNLMLSPMSTIAISELRMMAPDGRCKTFDASADGFVRSEGCGVVVLKRLSDARKNGDRILAVIRGSAVNQDGRSGGLTAPNGPAQEAVIRRALATGRVAPVDVQYVEAHGTGTALGDPIEVQALAAVLGEGRAADRPVAIGSVKTNVGHLEAAAGVAGLIKTVLALQHERIPPHLHLKNPSPHISWKDIPVVVPVEGKAWPSGGEGRRIAGVSSFGFSGTNAHVVLEEAPSPGASRHPLPEGEGHDRPLHVLTLTAKSGEALTQLAGLYADHLEKNPAESFADVCFTANIGRARFEHRLAVVAANAEQAVEKLRLDRELIAGRSQNASEPKIAFLFTGQGSQYAGMGRVLYETQPVFRETMNRCEELLKGRLERPLLSVLYPEAATDRAIHETGYTQPALFALEYGLAEVWRSWGIRPRFVAGHSVGEYVAACVAGVFTLEEAIRLVAERGRLMQRLERRGTMVAVTGSEEEIRRQIEPVAKYVAVAAVNGPANVVISGDEGKVEEMVRAMESAGMRTQALRVSHGFHSPLMDEMLPAFREAADKVKYGPPQIGLVSNVTGVLVKEGEVERAGYWEEQLREPVQFRRMMATLVEQGCGMFLEAGPKPTLMMMGQQCVGTQGVWVSSLREGRDDWQQMLTAVGQLYVNGATVDWESFDRAYARRRVTLPTYPFQRKRYWFENSKAPAPASDAATTNWLYDVQWEPRPRFSIPSPRAIAPSLERQRIALNSKHQMELYREFVPLLDELTTSYIADALRQLGWRWEDRLSVVTPHRSLLIRLFGIVEEEGLLRSNGESPLHAVQDFVRSHPQLNAEFTLLERCGRNLAGVLKGTINPLEVLFPGGSLATLEKLYQDSPASRACNGLVQGAVSAALEKLPKGRSVRILEIGAGTGGTTTYVLPVVSGIASEYVFTDVSPQFTSKAETKFRDYPFVRYQILDIERAPIEQGFRPHEFDIVLAANVLHATADLRQVLGHVKQLLTPEGLVVLLEGTGPQRWLDLIFGMTEGWWKFRDDDVRESHPLLRQDRWLALLEECGFVDPVAVPGVEESRTGVPEPALIMARSPVEMKKEDGRWLIFGDERGVGGSLAAALEKAGERTELVLASEGQGVRRVVEKEKWRGIVHLWSLDQTVEDLEKAQQQGCGSVLEVVQAVVGKSEARPPRLWLVTGGAQAAGENEGPLNVAQAPLWGFGRVIALEHPDLGCTCVDVEATITPDRIDALAAELLAADDEDQIALRNSTRYVARLISIPGPGVRPETFDVRPDRTYLITGGLGDLGLKTANWLASRGARHIVLIGRTGLPESCAPKNDAIRALERRGVEVHIEKADVADLDQMRSIIRRIQNGTAPLRGVIHAAAQIEPCTLKEMSVDFLRAGLRAKVYGTWVLHELTKDTELDFFVSFSSTTSLLGSSHLAHYAAANQFLDAFAHYRHALHLPALTINWGIWDQFRGADASGTPSLKQSGLNVMSSSETFSILEWLLKSSVTQRTVAAIDWNVLKPAYEARRRRPFLERIVTTSPAIRQSSERTDLLRRLESASAVQRRELLTDHIRDEVRKVLGFDATFVPDPQQGFFEMGMDSLTSVELKSRLENSLGKALPTTMALEYPTIEQLVRFIEAEILPPEHASPPPQVAQIAEPDVEDLDRHSREELLTLLAAELRAVEEQGSN